MMQINKEKVYIFSQYISKLRKEHGYTLNEVAEKTNLKTTSLHKIENGEYKKINPIFLSNLAKLYDINILVFYTMLGYIEENDIILFSEILIFIGANNFPSLNSISYPYGTNSL